MSLVVYFVAGVTERCLSVLKRKMWVELFFLFVNVFSIAEPNKPL